MEKQVERTNAILDRYVKMLGQQEQIAKLVLDEEWKGGEAVSIARCNVSITLLRLETGRTNYPGAN